MIRKIINWGLMALLGFFLVFSLYNRFVTTRILKNYRETFQQLSHPVETGLLDEFQSKFVYYPATYHDESIKNECVYLVGELRSYTGNWDEIKEFYAGKTVLHDGIGELHVGEFPMLLVQDTATSFDMDEDYLYGPFAVDILAKLENDYYFWGFPDEFDDFEGKIYAVYIVPDCE
jgi:hypothetical protein